MTVTYIVHKYAGTQDDKAVTVTGEIAKLVLSYQHDQNAVGITILEVNNGCSN